MQLKNEVMLIRVRNPWGRNPWGEWNGPWSDRSREWKSLSKTEKAKHGLVFDNDGEFYMTVSDFVKHFQSLEICNLTRDSLDDESDPR